MSTNGQPYIEEVYAGRFICPHCNTWWVGSWHGAKKDITCIMCKKLIFHQDEESENEND